MCFSSEDANRKKDKNDRTSGFSNNKLNVVKDDNNNENNKKVIESENTENEVDEQFQEIVVQNEFNQIEEFYAEKPDINTEIVEDTLKQLDDENEKVVQEEIKENKLIETKKEDEENAINRDKIQFLKNKKYLKSHLETDSLYSKTLFETGMLYEKLYKDYFRGACHVYLATLFEKGNKEYEDNYIRLCNLVREKHGVEWEYYVTLVHNRKDIEKYIDELIHKRKKDVTPIKQAKPMIKQSINSSVPKQKQIKKEYKQESKFDDFNTESYLHSLGYKVGASGLSVQQRRRLLSKVLNSGKISKYDVISTLERNISMFGHRKDRRKAVEDWENDLRYIKNNF